MGRLLLAIVLLVALACAPRLQRPGPRDWKISEADRIAIADEALRDWLELWNRLLETSHRVREAGAGDCRPDVSPLFGSFEARRDSFDQSAVVLSAATALFQLGERPTILALVGGSPLERAGARVGDQILEVQGKSVGWKGDPETMFVELAPEDGGPVEVVLERGGEEVVVSVEQVFGCRNTIHFDDSDHLSLRIGARRVKISPERWVIQVIVSRGLVELTRSSDELGAVMAHLVAHGALALAERRADKQADRRRKQPVLPDKEAVTALEIEADRLGIEIAARAGYRASAARTFWERLALESPGRIASGHHGYLADRLEALRSAGIGMRSESSEIR